LRCLQSVAGESLRVHAIRHPGAGVDATLEELKKFSPAHKRFQGFTRTFQRFQGFTRAFQSKQRTQRILPRRIAGWGLPVRLPFLVRAGTAFSFLSKKIEFARTPSTLHGGAPRHGRENRFVRLPVEQQSASPYFRFEPDDRSPFIEHEPTTRVFLVGCERSGTTLLQSLLAAHSKIHSVPETHFVKRLFRNGNLPSKHGGRHARLRRALRSAQAWRREMLAGVGWISGRHAEAAWREVEGDPERPSSFWDRHSAHAHMRSFIDAMDADCRHAGKRIWLEKTPGHLAYIPVIRRHVPGARFIHLVRDGSEVVASLNRLAKTYPQWRPFMDTSFAVERWNHAWRASKRWIGHPGHLVVRYETLVLAPRRTLARILQFLDCDPESDLWKVYPQVAGRLIRADEPWKAGNMRSLRDRRKFAKSFDPATQSRILDALEAPDWRTLSRAPGVIADSGTFHD
jgi:hypothetical protein